MVYLQQHELWHFKVKKLVDLQERPTSEQRTKCLVPSCPLFGGSTVYIYTREMRQPTRVTGSLRSQLDIRISADASRRLQLKAAACQTFAVYQENHGDPLQVYTSNHYYLAHAQNETYIYIIIYPSREPSAQS